MTCSDEDLRETVLSSRETYRGSFLRVARETVRLPDGRIAEREMLRRGPAVAIVPLFDDGTTLLERQWRASVGCAFWEVPAGMVDPGEEPDHAAVRELREECGLQARGWTWIGDLHSSIGCSGEVIRIYAARGFSETAQDLDENEFLRLRRLPLEECFAMIDRGEITDGKTVGALALLERHLAGRIPGRSFRAD